MEIRRTAERRAHPYRTRVVALEVVAIALVAAIASGCRTSPHDEPSPPAARAHSTPSTAPGSFALESPTFVRGGVLPATAAFDGPGCGGANRSPELALRDPPTGTRSFALLLHDPDAGPDGFDHWIVFDLPPGTSSLALGADPRRLGAHVGRNDFGGVGYAGPCPPPGPAHRYVFTVHALDVATLGLDDGASAATVRERIEAHELARASLEGRYAREVVGR